MTRRQKFFHNKTSSELSCTRMGSQDKNLGGGGMNLKVNAECEVRDWSVCAGIVEWDTKVVRVAGWTKFYVWCFHDLK